MQSVDFLIWLLFFDANYWIFNLIMFFFNRMCWFLVWVMLFDAKSYVCRLTEVMWCKVFIFVFECYNLMQSHGREGEGDKWHVPQVSIPPNYKWTTYVHRIASCSPFVAYVQYWSINNCHARIWHSWGKWRQSVSLIAWVCASICQYSIPP